MTASYLGFHISHTGFPSLPSWTSFEGELRRLEGNMDRTQTDPQQLLPLGQKALFCICWPSHASENSGSTKHSFWTENKKSTLRVRQAQEKIMHNDQITMV